MQLNNIRKILRKITKPYPFNSKKIERDYKKIETKLLEHFEPVGRGAFRFVVKGKADDGTDVAIKSIAKEKPNGLIGKDGQWLYAYSNRNEWDLYNWFKKNRKHVAKFLLKPIALITVNKHQFLVVPLVNTKRGSIKGWNKKVIHAFKCYLIDMEGCNNWTIHNGIPTVIDWNIWRKTDITKHIDDVFKALWKIKKK